MLKSDACILNEYENYNFKEVKEDRYDPGGYFIISGGEKVVVAQERMNDNHVYLFKNKFNAKYRFTCQIQSKIEDTFDTPHSTILKYDKNNQITVNVKPGWKDDIPLFLLFRALGPTSDKEIINYIAYEENDYPLLDLLKPSIEYESEMKDKMKDKKGQPLRILTQEDALEYIADRAIPKHITKKDKDFKIRYILDIIDKHVFPHVGDSLIKKTYFLGYMTNKLLQGILERIQTDDRDNYANKRIDVTGVLLAKLFRALFSKTIDQIKTTITKEFSNKVIKKHDLDNLMPRIVKSSIIEQGLRTALTTGNWSLQKGGSSAITQGVAQVLGRKSYLETISYLRRVVTPINKDVKLVESRRLQPTHWGILCPSETPEGQSVGLTKNLSLMAEITDILNSDPVIQSVNEEDIILLNDIEPSEIGDTTKIFVNGDWIACTTKAVQVTNNLKEKRRMGFINPEISIVKDTESNEIRIYTDAGRAIRPLLIVEDNKLNITKKHIELLKNNDIEWSNLIKSSELGGKSIIEYIDVQESQANSLIAMRPSIIYENFDNKSKDMEYRYSHCEINPAVILGVCTSAIPFSNHNQAPRNTYQCLDINTPVLMKDQSFKLIKDIKVGEEVQTFDPISMKTSYTKIINQYVKETEKQMFNVKTYSGKSFNATFDHKFMTFKGWREVLDLDLNNDLIGIKPSQIQMSTSCDNKLIISEESFSGILSKLNIENTLVKKYINNLKSKNLLPLYSNNSKINIISRMLGYIYSKGNFSHSNDSDKILTLQVTFNDKISAELFENDINLLGYSKNNLQNTSNISKVNHQGFKSHKFMIIASLFKCLEFTNDIPDWIINGSDLIKREFLSGIHGSNNCLIKYDNDFISQPYHYQVNLELKKIYIKYLKVYLIC